MNKKCKKPQVRELVEKNGIDYPSDNELIMLMLGKGTKKNHIENMSEEVMSAINSTNQEQLIGRLMEITGIGKTRAFSIAAALELGRRKNSCLKAVINGPEDIIPFVKHYAIEPKEHFLCISLNGAHELIKISVISVGTISKTLIHPRELFAEAITQRASGIICCHNHPYGACYPSEADLETTEILQNAANILSIAFVDHIIISTDEYYSFKEHDLLK